MQDDVGRKMMTLLCERLIDRLMDKESVIPASELEVVRKLLTDNSVTLSSVQRGDFGATAKAVAEEFPFQNPLHAVPN